MKTVELVGAAIGGVVAIVVMIVVISLLMAYPVKWTWNATIPYLFSLPVLTWGKAWCITFLATTLIKTSVTK